MRTKAKVYFADFHMPYGGDPLPVKLRKLMKKAGFEELDLKDKFVAIKMHFGEKGNLAFFAAQLRESRGGLREGTRRQAFSDGLQYLVRRQPEECPGAFGYGL